MICPRCGSVMKRLRNEFYGVGLAVHEHVHECPQCGYFEFAGRSPEPEDEMPPETPAPHRFRTLLKRISAWGR